MTDLQKQTLARVILATNAGRWYRAGASLHLGDRAFNSGERVTLASLHRNGLCDRRAWRGAAGAANTAYEYQATARVMQLARELYPETFKPQPKEE